MATDVPWFVSISPLDITISWTDQGVVWDVETDGPEKLYWVVAQIAPGAGAFWGTFL